MVRRHCEAQRDEVIPPAREREKESPVGPAWMAGTSSAMTRQGAKLSELRMKLFKRREEPEDEKGLGNLAAFARTGLAFSKLQYETWRKAERSIPARLRENHTARVTVALVAKKPPPPKKRLRDIFANLHGPRWLPVYDIEVFLAKYDSEQPFPGSMVSAQYTKERRFEEYRALVEICEMARGNVATESEEEKIKKVLEINSVDSFPNYKRLLELLKDNFDTKRLPSHFRRPTPP